MGERVITRCVAYMGERVVRKKKRAKKACEWRGIYAGSKFIDHLAVSRGCPINTVKRALFLAGAAVSPAP